MCVCVCGNMELNYISYVTQRFYAPPPHHRPLMPSIHVANMAFVFPVALCSFQHVYFSIEYKLSA